MPYKYLTTLSMWICGPGSIVGIAIGYGLDGPGIESINDHIAEPIPIHCSIRQGCPMSMMLYAMSVDPLFRILEQKLTGIRIGKRGPKTVAVAYADDITTFVTTPTDIPVIQETINCYEKATGARLNTRKSGALAVGGWSTNTNVLNIHTYLLHGAASFLRS